MEDKEKVLRWNLQESLNEMDKPYDIGGNLIGSVAFGMMKYREEQVKKCRQELDDYLSGQIKI